MKKRVFQHKKNLKLYELVQVDTNLRIKYNEGWHTTYIYKRYKEGIGGLFVMSEKQFLLKFTEVEISEDEKCQSIK